MTLPLAHEEVMEEVEAAPSSVREGLRARCKNSLYFLAKGVMQHKDVNKPVHAPLCKFIEEDEHDTRLALLPRFHLKTTVATETRAIQCGLQDPENCRVLIVNEIDQNAKDMLTVVRSAFEKNDLIKELFPECIHERFTGPGIEWNSEGASLPNKNPKYKESSWMAAGIKTAITSKHFTEIIADDIIGFEARHSPAVMAFATKWVKNVEPLRIDAHGATHLNFIGTRWAENDIYQLVIDTYGESLGIHIRRVIENDQIIFPAKITQEYLSRLEPEVLDAQFLNDPTSSVAKDFDSKLLRSFTFDTKGNVVFLKNGETRRWPVAILDKVIVCDPNSGSKTAPDEAAWTCVGTSPDDENFVLESFGGRPNPTEFVESIADGIEKWRPRLVGIEKAGQQNTIHYLGLELKRRRAYCLIVELHHKNQEKDQRIRQGLQPIINSGDLFLLPTQTQLREQISKFPNVTLKDRIDSLSYFVQYKRTPQKTEVTEQTNSLVKQILARRNPRTGYGR